MTGPKIGVNELVHLYHDGAFGRRELLERLTKLTGSAVVAAAVLAADTTAPVCGTCPADVKVPADAPDLDTADVQFPGDASTLNAYTARLKSDNPTPLPAVLVIHENQGLTEHIRDVTRRVARAGYFALGVDLLSRVGGIANYPDPAQRVAAYNSLSADARLADMLTSVAYMKSRTDLVSGDKVGIVGFCAGGGNVWTMAVSSDDIGASVVYYGQPPAVDQLDNLKAPVLCHYAELDMNFSTRVLQTAPSLLTKKKSFELHIYKGVGHAFNNDTGPAYNHDAACKAWARTIEWFDQNLKPAPAAG